MQAAKSAAHRRIDAEAQAFGRMDQPRPALDVGEGALHQQRAEAAAQRRCDARTARLLPLELEAPLAVLAAVGLPRDARAPFVARERASVYCRHRSVRGRGRVARIKKRTCHITVQVAQREGSE